MRLPAQVLERSILAAPLGVVLWDAVTDRRVWDGLELSVHSADRPDLRIRAAANPSGVFVFPYLPRQRAAVFIPEAGPAVAPGSPPNPPQLVVEVLDTRGHFVPYQVMVTGLVGGLLSVPCGSGVFSDIAPPGALPMFSAPGRPAEGGRATVRVELCDASRMEPARWAIVEAWYGPNRLGRGLADEGGRATLMFAYPEPAPGSPPAALTSPPTGHGRRPAEQAWPLTLRVYFAPGAFVSRDPAVPRRPDLCRTLAQPVAQIYASLSPLEVLPDQTLRFGQSLAVKPDNASVVYLLPEGSPPA